jgi:serine/threonine protein kinase
MPRSVGDWLGNRYEIVDVIAGGMGVVYAAVDRLEGGPVGLKTLRSEYLCDRERQGRFLTEARLWVGLDPHPNVVLADAIETFDGLPHIRLEWITGGHLGRWIATPRLDFPRALRFTVQFCLGMEHAQRGGVRCHRDVKPANLLVTEEGTLKITDFGLARLRDGLSPEDLALRDEPIALDEPTEAQPIVWTDHLDRKSDRSAGATLGERAPARVPAPPEVSRADLEPARPTLDASAPLSDSSDPDATVAWTPGPRGSDANYRTRTNAVVGTVHYMAPEQFQDASAVDVRTDIYAFGIVLYEMLAGERPFKGYSVARLRHAHLNATPRPVGGLLPRRWRRFADAIDAVVLRCLEKDPQRRYASAAALRNDVQSILRKVDPTWRP